MYRRSSSNVVESLAIDEVAVSAASRLSARDFRTDDLYVEDKASTFRSRSRCMRWYRRPVFETSSLCLRRSAFPDALSTGARELRLEPDVPAEFLVVPWLSRASLSPRTSRDASNGFSLLRCG